jgi:hypothetical protein
MTWQKKSRKKKKNGEALKTCSSDNKTLSTTKFIHKLKNYL